MADDDGTPHIDLVELTRVIERLLAQGPGSTARDIVAALPDAVRGRVTRRDVNSVLYRGAGRAFIRSDDAKPRWRLGGASLEAPAHRTTHTTERGTKSGTRTSRRTNPSEANPQAPLAPSPDAPAPEDIARILFDD